MSNIFTVWDFYKKLGGIVGNLPMDEVISFSISGSVNDLPTMIIKQYMKDENGKLIIDRSKNEIESKEVKYIVITEDEYNKLTGNV